MARKLLIAGAIASAAIGAGSVAAASDGETAAAHAEEPNFGFLSENEAVALRDIAAGKELTCDYNIFFEDGFEFLGDR